MQSGPSIKKIVFSRIGIVIQSIIIFIFILRPMYFSWEFILNYNSNLGYKPGVFGFPKEFNEMLFEAILWAILVLTNFLILIIKKAGWFIGQILLYSAIIILIFFETINITKTINYLSIENVFILIGIIWYSFYLSKKEIVRIFFNNSFKKKYYLGISFGTISLLIVGIITYW